MKTGIVKFFDGRPEKRFGFVIEDGTKKEIFFHLNDGQRIYAGNTKPEFCPDRRLDRIPQRGDRLVFEITPGSKGDKACPWGFEDDFRASLNTISSRPVYRIIVRLRTVGTGNETGPTVLWSGTNLNERNIEQHYHPMYDRPGSNGDIEWRKYWEESPDGGKTWYPCDCPRDYKHQFDSRGNRRIPNTKKGVNCG